MSEYYAVRRSSEYLAHYGVKGMKWGVRKFAKDNYANPSNKFNRLYGSGSKKRVSARRMQRHYNSLDQSRANIIQGNINRIHSTGETIRYANARQNGKLTDYDKKYIERSMQGVSDGNKQLKNIAAMQDRIIKTAHKKHYSVNLSPIERSGRIGLIVKSNGNKASIKKPRKYFTKQDFKDAFKAAGIGIIGGPYAGYGYTLTKQSQRIANEKKRRR